MDCYKHHNKEEINCQFCKRIGDGKYDKCVGATKLRIELDSFVWKCPYRYFSESDHYESFPHCSVTDNIWCKPKRDCLNSKLMKRKYKLLKIDKISE
jgi:hypothetical protein